MVTESYDGTCFAGTSNAAMCDPELLTDDVLASSRAHVRCLKMKLRTECLGEWFEEKKP